MINARERQEAYRQAGLVVEAARDEPGVEYPQHEHERTVLYTIAGSLTLRVGYDESCELVPGTEFVIDSGQPHEAKVGPKGWKYLAAWDAKEAEAFAAVEQQQ